MPRARAGRARNGTGSVKFWPSRNLWRARVDIDGETFTYYAQTQKEASDKMTGALRAGERGEPILTATQARVTVASWLIEWLAGLKATADKGGIALSTYRCYRSYTKNHLIPKLGRKKLVQLTTKDVRDMMASRLGQERTAMRETEDGRTVKTGGRKGGTAYVANQCLVVLRAALSQAVSDGDKGLTRNVAAQAKKLKWEEAEVKPLEPEQIVLLLKELQGERIEAISLLVMTLGVREQEALGLRETDLDIDGRVAYVRRALGRDEGQYYVKELKTRYSKRDLRIPEFIIPALLRWQDIQRADKKRAEQNGQQWVNAFNLFFTNELGGPMNASWLLHAFQRVLERAGLPGKRFYDLRHQAASVFHSEGMDLREVQEQLGWSNLSMATRYVHLFKEAAQRPAEIMDRLYQPPEKSSPAPS